MITMGLDKITLISLQVNDQDKMKSFYVNKLGFKVLSDFIMGESEAGNQSGNRWISIEPPGGGPAFTLTTWFKDIIPGHMKLSLSTSDVDKTYHELKEKGLKPNDEISDAPWGRWFSINDPEGNNLLIVQETSNSHKE